MKTRANWLSMSAMVILLVLTISAAGPHQASAAQIGDGVLRVYGAGGPRAPIEEALRLFEQRTGTPFQLVAGPTGQWLDIPVNTRSARNFYQVGVAVAETI